MTRPLCICGLKPAAINYRKDGRIYYRSKCETCLRYGGVGKGMPKWYQDGYRMKSICDKCGFKAKILTQLLVFHVDGNLNNSEQRNLKTVCLNCIELIKKTEVTWRRGDLEPDL